MKYEKHGMQGTPIYESWLGMKKRCYKKNRKDYKYYGGRGITVCDNWVNSFLSFYKDMGEKPTPNHSIDRIDNNKGYSKENCRWANKTTQSINQRLRKDNTSGYKGVGFNKKRNMYCSYIRINGVQKHLGYFNEKEEAIESRKKAEKDYFNELV